MSADNGIYILQSEGPEWRVVHTQAIENIHWNEDSGNEEPDYFNEEELKRYFGKSTVFIDETEARDCAFALEREISESVFPILEYGISTIVFPSRFPG